MALKSLPIQQTAFVFLVFVQILMDIVFSFTDFFFKQMKFVWVVRDHVLLMKKLSFLRVS